MAINPSTAFFSYSREDSEFVLRLAEDLKASGADVWLDQLDIQPGQRWARAVQDALTDCLTVLVVVSPSSVDSQNVQDEVTFAIEEKKTVVPVFHRDCRVPLQLRSLQYADFRTDYARGLKALVRTLAAGPRPQSDQPAQATASTDGRPSVADDRSSRPRVDSAYAGLAHGTHAREEPLPFQDEPLRHRSFVGRGPAGISSEKAPQAPTLLSAFRQAWLVFRPKKPIPPIVRPFFYFFAFAFSPLIIASAGGIFCRDLLKWVIYRATGRILELGPRRESSTDSNFARGFLQAGQLLSNWKWIAFIIFIAVAVTIALLAKH